MTTLAIFDGASGADPEGKLTIDDSGDLFGTTYAGGQNGRGTVFELSPTGAAAAPEPASLVLILSMAAAPMFGAVRRCRRARG